MIPPVTLRPAPALQRPGKAVAAAASVRFGNLSVPVLRLEQAPHLQNILSSIETAVAAKDITLESISPTERKNGRDINKFRLKLGEIPVELEKQSGTVDTTWILTFPTKNLQLSYTQDVNRVFPIIPHRVYFTTTKVSSLDGTSLPFEIKGARSDWRIYRVMNKLDKGLKEAVIQQAVTQQQTVFKTIGSDNAKTALKNLLQFQVELLNSKKTHFEPLIQQLTRQHAEAQATWEASEKQDALVEKTAKERQLQLELAQLAQQEHIDAVMATIGELREKLVMLELTEDNDTLRQMMDSSTALIKASETRLKAVAQQIELGYHTSRVGLNPEETIADADLRERVQQRTAQNTTRPTGETTPSALEAALQKMATQPLATETLH